MLDRIVNITNDLDKTEKVGGRSFDTLPAINLSVFYQQSNTDKLWYKLELISTFYICTQHKANPCRTKSYKICFKTKTTSDIILENGIKLVTSIGSSMKTI